MVIISGHLFILEPILMRRLINSKVNLSVSVSKLSWLSCCINFNETWREDTLIVKEGHRITVYRDKQHTRGPRSGHKLVIYS